jgi:flotillin
LEYVVTLACGGVAAAVGLLLLVAIARQFLFICRPNQILIFSGRQVELADGTKVGYRVVNGGFAFRVPLLERVDSMDLSTMPLDLHVTNAYSRGGIPLNVHAIANVKIASSTRVVGNAIERFLSRDPAEIRRVAKESLEAHVRGVLATLTPEEINTDRLKFANALVDEADADLHKLGLQLDTLKIQNVSDDVKYLDSIGRQQIAGVLMVADIAESTAKSEAEQAEAASNRDGQVAVQQAEATIIQRENELRKVKAELESQARSEEERTTQLTAEARALAEQELQRLRKEVEEARLMADVVLPARAKQQAEALAARGTAAVIAENGRAGAAVLQMLVDAWTEAGHDAREIFLMQQVEEVLSSVALPVSAVQVGEVALVDSGDGKALANYLSGYPAAVNAILEELRRTTGVDVLGTMGGGAK